MLVSKPTKIDDLFDRLDEMPCADWDIDHVEVSGDDRTFTLIDYAGSRFVFKLIEHVKPAPYKHRVAEAMAAAIRNQDSSP